MQARLGVVCLKPPIPVATGTAENTGLLNLNVEDIKIDSAKIAFYAGTFGGGVFKSTDFDNPSWVASNNGLTNPNILELAIDPGDNTRIYAGTDGGGVFRSENSGSRLGFKRSTVISPTTPMSEALAIDLGNKCNSLCRHRAERGIQEH